MFFDDFFSEFKKGYIFLVPAISSFFGRVGGSHIIFATDGCLRKSWYPKMDDLLMEKPY